MSDSLTDEALAYHEAFPPGKLRISATKEMRTQRDLALAYSPGVSQPCLEIFSDPTACERFTARGNLVAVVTNGTAVLGLGNIGPMAAKPVMEGKAVLFKKFSGLDAFDLEVAETDVEKFCDIVAALEPTFGGINLEDIKAPECFEIEQCLRDRMSIPVFHDDQHGTAIVTLAALINALKLVGKSISDVRIVCNGAGAAAIAVLDLLVSYGAQLENIVVCDRKGVISKDRLVSELEPSKARFASDTTAANLVEAMEGADVFIGLSAAGAIATGMVESMAQAPIIFAMANPDPEITPAEAFSARSDVIVATGRSDFPNQVNNVLCFPFIFRGAMDCGATEINEEMKIACAEALAKLALDPVHPS
jgi:malate dehydrogenase (oxaloacetate-decarboxylating)(NADP+)